MMGVAVLQLYTGKDNRTGPQTIELLTRRIVNLGAVQAGQVGDPSLVIKTEYFRLRAPTVL